MNAPLLWDTQRRSRAARLAPKLGDDADAVLGKIGFPATDIAALRGRKVVA